jgi:hypothetical protein
MLSMGSCACRLLHIPRAAGLRRVVLRAGIASTQEPDLRSLPGLSAGASTSAAGTSTLLADWGVILLGLPRGITIVTLP